MQWLGSVAYYFAVPPVLYRHRSPGAQGIGVAVACKPSPRPDNLCGRYGLRHNGHQISFHIQEPWQCDKWMGGVAWQFYGQTSIVARQHVWWMRWAAQ